MISSFAGATFSIGMVVATIGALFTLFQPGKINWIYGYRTVTAMRSQDAWNFANRYAAKAFFLVGLSAMALGLLSFFIAPLNQRGAVAGLLLVCAAMIGVIVFTELALRHTFDKEGRRKA